MNRRQNAGMTVYAVQYVYDPRADVRDEVRPEHRRFLAELFEAGALLASGPWTGPTEGHEPGAPEAAAEADGALLLLRAESRADAEAVLDRDPFARRGLVARRTLRPWNPVFGPWS